MSPYRGRLARPGALLCNGLFALLACGLLAGCRGSAGTANGLGIAGAPSPKPLVGWTGWRGPNRDGISPCVPDRLPAKPKLLWTRPMTGLGLSGVVATGRYVIVADKDQDAKQDIFRCLAADTGAQVWTLAYAAAGDMDNTNSPRATPLIHNGLVYLLGAFGDLHCVKLDTGEVVWKRNIVQDFGARLLQWGVCASPLLVDDKLVVNPGARDASLVALDRLTGKVVWRSPGRPGAYASFIVGTFGGVRQIVGYDDISLGGWNTETGSRLWELRPEVEGDFNVPTPVAVHGKLLVATENNGTHLYGFDGAGRIQPKPLAQNHDLMPDTSTPVVLDGMVFGCAGALYCLDLDSGLKTLWEGMTDRAYDDYVSFTAGNHRLLVSTVSGELLLVAADRDAYRVVSRLRLSGVAEVWSHPALVGDRLYIRSDSSVSCVVLADG